MKLDCRKRIPPSVEKAISRVISLKVKHSQLPNNSIQINSGGPQPLTLSMIAVVARKESQDVTKRTVRSLTKQSKELLEMISGICSTQATATQASCAKFG